MEGGKRRGSRISLHPSPPPAHNSIQKPGFSSPQIYKIPGLSVKVFRGLGEGASWGGGRRTAAGTRPSSPRASPFPSPCRLPLPGLRSPPPRGRSPGGGGARSGAGAVATATPGGEARGGGARARPAPTQAAARGDPGRWPRPLTCPRRRAACRPRDRQAQPGSHLRRRSASTRGREAEVAAAEAGGPGEAARKVCAR